MPALDCFRTIRSFRQDRVSIHDMIQLIAIFQSVLAVYFSVVGSVCVVAAIHKSDNSENHDIRWGLIFAVGVVHVGASFILFCGAKGRTRAFALKWLILNFWNIILAFIMILSPHIFDFNPIEVSIIWGFLTFHSYFMLVVWIRAEAARDAAESLLPTVKFRNVNDVPVPAPASATA